MWYVVGVGVLAFWGNAQCALDYIFLCFLEFWSYLVGAACNLHSFGTTCWLYLLAVSLELLVAYELSRLTCHAACRSAAATT